MIHSKRSKNERRKYCRWTPTRWKWDTLDWGRHCVQAETVTCLLQQQQGEAERAGDRNSGQGLVVPRRTSEQAKIPLALRATCRRRSVFRHGTSSAEGTPAFAAPPPQLPRRYLSIHVGTPLSWAHRVHVCARQTTYRSGVVCNLCLCWSIEFVREKIPIQSHSRARNRDIIQSKV